MVPLPGKPVRLTGTVQAGTENGCLVLTSAEGSYVLTGAVADLEPGETVALAGRIDPAATSTCQQGHVFLVTSTSPR